jgi:uncharacterized damage-inducible protein DinB
MPIQRLLLLSVLAAASLPATAQTPAQPKPAPTLRSILLAQLRSTHNTEEWFVPIDTAIEGLTPDQAKWVPTNKAGKIDPNANHSVGQLANHLLFWNTHELATFKGEKLPGPANNDETFNDFDAATWTTTVKKLDAVLTAWEQAIEQADDTKLAANAELIAHISAHNAYHVGQILYVRKLQGAWDPAKGVK